MRNTTTAIKETFAKEVRALLALSPGHVKISASKEYKVVTAIINAMKEALLRGEEVSIMGFGTFRAITQPPRKRMYACFYIPGNKHPYRRLETVPSKTRIHFRPSEGLKRFVNEESK